MSDWHTAAVDWPEWPLRSLDPDYPLLMPEWNVVVRGQRLADLGYRPTPIGYEHYLDGPEWADARARYVASGKPTSCFVCATKGVEYHHRAYARLGMETPEDLVPLCRRHHEKVGKYVLKRWACQADAHMLARAYYVDAVLLRHRAALLSRARTALNEPERFGDYQDALDRQAAGGLPRGELSTDVAVDVSRHAADALALWLWLAGEPEPTIPVVATFPYQPGAGSRWMVLHEHDAPHPECLFVIPWRPPGILPQSVPFGDLNSLREVLQDAPGLALLLHGPVRARSRLISFHAPGWRPMYR